MGRRKCQAKPAQALLGKPYTEALRAKAQAASHARLVQALRRGDATTAEFRSDRLDIIIDPKTNACDPALVRLSRAVSQRPRGSSTPPANCSALGD